jgi:Skp family chaperone for outer membrane proteins
MANDKISYVNMDYLITNTIAGKSLLENLKKEEKLKVDKFKISDEDYKNKEKKNIS